MKKLIVLLVLLTLGFCFADPSGLTEPGLNSTANPIYTTHR